MKLIEFLATSLNARVSDGDKWLVVSYDSNRVFTFTVYERKPYARKTTTIIETYDEEKAVTALAR